MLEVVVQNSVYSRSRIRGQNNFWIDSKTIFGGATLTFRHGFYVVVVDSKFSAHNQVKRVIAIVSL